MVERSNRSRPTKTRKGFSELNPFFWYQLYSDRIYAICYKDLTTYQEEETRKLLEYCELDWDENCLNFHISKREVKNPVHYKSEKICIKEVLKLGRSIKRINSY